MAGLSRMDIERRRSGRRQGRGDLARDMPGLADPGDDDASGHPEQLCDRVAERTVEVGGKARQRLRLQRQHAARGGDRRNGRVGLIWGIG